MWAFLKNDSSVPTSKPSKKRPTLDLASASEYKPLKKRKDINSEFSQKITKLTSTSMKNPFHNSEPSDIASNFSLSMLSLNSTIKPEQQQNFFREKPKQGKYRHMNMQGGVKFN